VAVRIERRRRGGRIRHTVAPLPTLARQRRPPPEVHEQRVFDPDAVSRWLEAAGFVPRQLPGYPGLRKQPGRVVFVAVRAAPAPRAKPASA